MTVCPSCNAENIPGTEFCDECGSDLRALALPEARTEFEEHLMNDHLRDIAAAEALSVSPGDPVTLAIHFMRKQGVECILVRDDGDEIIGILTERDIMMKAAGPGTDLSALAVKDIMTVDPVMLRETDTLAVALHKMSIGGFRHMPFVAEDGPTLLVSAQDVFIYVSRFINSN
jgi:CBS domain-containing protein